MLRFYVRVALIFTMLFALCGVVFIAFGHTQPMSPALRGFVEGCEGVTEPQLCWNGIVAYETQLQEAQERLGNAGYSRTQHTLISDSSVFGNGYYQDVYERTTGHGCSIVQLAYNVGLPNPSVVITALEDCHNLSLLDAVDFFGEPEGIDFHFNIVDFDNILYITFLGRNPEWNSPVNQIHLQDVNLERVNIVIPGGFREWGGFYPLWWYCLPMPVDYCLSVG